MSLNKPATHHSSFVPAQWIGRDGMPLTCDEKILMLNDSLEEIHELCQHAFEEATQMGCSEEFLRIVLQDMVTSLKRAGKRPFSC